MDRFSQHRNTCLDAPDFDRQERIAADRADQRDEKPATVKPVRIQLSRRKGFNLQNQSMMVNGLPAVNVARPSRWGNPYKVGIGPGLLETCAEAKAAFFNYTWRTAEGIQLIKDAKRELRGKNLACWCKTDECHASVLLKLVNE